MTETTNRQETHQKIFLSVNEGKEFGYELINVMNRLEMTNCAIYGLEFVQKSDQESFNCMVRNFLSVTHEQNLKICYLLDKIAFRSLECDDEKELRSYALSSNNTQR